jgi:hypothetical protein
MQLSVSAKEAWQPRKGFLGLPRELRELIYELVLVEPPKWERRHKSTCDHAPSNTTQFETPPFNTWELCQCRLDRGCDCALRSVGLLAVNRRIHAEAAPVFWTRNVFSFATAEQFAQSMGKFREESRRLIRHVSILGVHWELHQKAWPDTCYHWELSMGTRAMWTRLRQLPGLRTLEVGVEKLYCPEWVDDYDGDDSEEEDDSEEPFRNYAEWLVTNREFWPRLEEFAFARMLVYDGNPRTSRRDILTWEMPYVEKRRLVHVKARQVLDLGGIDSKAKAQQAAVKFRTNYLVHVKHALETTLFGVAESDFTTSDELDLPFKYELREGMNESHARQELKLRDGSVATVQLLGLPVCKQTAIRYAKERRRDNAERKAAGKPTRQQEKADTKVKERAAAKQEEKDGKEMLERENELEARRKRLTALLEEEERGVWEGKRREETKVTELRVVERESKRVERKKGLKPKQARIKYLSQS